MKHPPAGYACAIFQAQRQDKIHSFTTCRPASHSAITDCLAAIRWFSGSTALPKRGLTRSLERPLIAIDMGTQVTMGRDLISAGA